MTYDSGAPGDLGVVPDQLQDQGVAMDLPVEQLDSSVKDSTVDLPPQKPLGASCNSDAECQSGYCIEKAESTQQVCCDRYCPAIKWDEGCQDDGHGCEDGH